MKKISFILICLSAFLSFYSCNLFEEDNKPKPSEEIRQVEVLPDSIKKKIEEQNDLMTALVCKVDTLTQELNTAKTETAELQKKMSELKSPKSAWAYISIGACVLALIAIVIALLKRRGVSEEKVYEIVEKCLDDSRRIKELQVSVRNLLSTQRISKNTQFSSPYAPNTDSQLRQFESQLSQVKTVVNELYSLVQNSTQYDTKQRMTHKEPDYQKVGYAKNDKDMYFTTIYDSNQEGCVFKIVFTSPTKGKFNLISLDKIQSRNDWQLKVECSGISIKEASDFRVEDEGICEKIDENTWKVTQPLKIRLLK